MPVYCPENNILFSLLSTVHGLANEIGLIVDFHIQNHLMVWLVTNYKSGILQISSK